MSNNNDRKISQLQMVQSLTGGELIPVVQGGQNKRTTISDIVTYANETYPAPEPQVSIYNEIPSGVVDGNNLTFSTLESFRASSTRVFLNGLRVCLGIGKGYQETGANQITFSEPPLPGDELVIDYDLAMP